MVPAVNPERLLLKVPVVPGTTVLLLVVVGLPVVFQQMPRAVIADPPSIFITPPLEAVVLVIPVTVVVLISTGVDNAISFPFGVLPKPKAWPRIGLRLLN